MAACPAPSPSSSSSARRWQAGSPRGGPCGTPPPAALSPPSGSRDEGGSWDLSGQGELGCPPPIHPLGTQPRESPSTHQLGVGCSAEGEHFPQEDPVAPHVRLGGEFLPRHKGGRLQLGGGCAGLPRAVPSSPAAPGAVLPSSGCDLAAWPSFTTRTPAPTQLSQPVTSHRRCPKSPPTPQYQDKSQILGDMGLVAPGAAVGQG